MHDLLMFPKENQGFAHSLINLKEMRIDWCFFSLSRAYMCFFVLFSSDLTFVCGRSPKQKNEYCDVDIFIVVVPL